MGGLFRRGFLCNGDKRNSYKCADIKRGDDTGPSGRPGRKRIVAGVFVYDVIAYYDCNYGDRKCSTRPRNAIPQVPSMKLPTVSSQLRPPLVI